MASFAVTLTTGDETFTTNETLKVEAWNMMCLGVSAAHATPTPTPEDESTTLQVWASLHGVPLEVPLVATVTQLEAEAEVCVGAHESGSASFTGFVTGVTLQAGQEMLVPDNCSLLLESNEVTVPLGEEWSSHGPVFLLEEQLQQPCQTSLNTLLLRDLGDYDHLLRLCRSLGGHFPTLEEAAAWEGQDLNCTSGEYVSWAQEEGVREEGPTALCPVLLAGGGQERWACLSELACSVCLVPAGLTYTLFGPRTDYDRHYNLTTRRDGTFFFQGPTSTFQHGPTGWSLQSRLHHKTLHLEEGVGVMGRHAWRAQGRAQNNASVTLAFTVCNALEFSTHEGLCVLRSERCDGRTDAPDRSDEQGCSSGRLIGKTEHYDAGVMPSRGKQHKLKLHYYMQAMVVHKMSTERGVANVEMNLNLRWQDDRIRFIDAKMQRNAFPCHEVWIPSFNVFAGYNSGPRVTLTDNRTLCYLSWLGSPTQELMLHDPMMGRYISGANISYYMNFAASYPCLLRVSRYPFGRYMCNFTISLFGNYEDVEWDIMDPRQVKGDPPPISYRGDHDLFDYRLEKITWEVHGIHITVTLHLRGQPDYHLTNSFLPSSLMFLICYSSFYFPIAGFNERIMVSLTSLLVLVALFSQATDSYVKTPYYKLIDVWYVALILLCFAVVIANGIVNYLRVQRVKTHSNLSKKVLLAKKFNIGSQAMILLSFGILLFVFFLFSSDTV